MNNIELYIQNTNGEYQAIDIFDNENIQVEDSIQNVKDISKIFSTFTRDFKVPASYENNKLFKHYYNLNIDNGFDGRVKTRALIKVGGVDFKEGYLRLLDVGLKNNKPSYYKLTFQGLITSLKDILEDDKVKDLDWSQFQFEDTVQKRVDGIRDGLYMGDTPETDSEGYELYPDMIYAPIFTKGKIVAVPHITDASTDDTAAITNNSYDFNLVKFTGVGETNVHSEVVGQDITNEFKHDVVTVFDYKPSIKVGRVIKMIGQQYGLEFEESFYQLEELDQLYLHFNGTKEEANVSSSSSAFNNNVGNNTSLDTNAINISEYTSESNPPEGTLSLSGSYNNTYTNAVATEDGFWRAYYTKGVFYPYWTGNAQVPAMQFTVQKFIRRADGSKLVLRQYVTDQSALQQPNGIQTLGLDAPSNDIGYYFDNIAGEDIHVGIIIQSNEEFANQLKIQGQYHHANSINNTLAGPRPQYSYNSVNDTTIASNAYINIVKHSPDIKLLDLILGVFKLFNLTSYIDENNKIQVLPLRDYYNQGKEIDLTNYIVTDSHSVANGFEYRNVSMKHQEPEDVLSKNFISNEPGVMYGDIKVSKETFLEDVEEGDVSQVAEGKDYVIESPFQRMMFEQLTFAWDTNQTSTNGVYSSAAGGLQTDMVIGNSIDDTLDGIETKPILFYGKQVNQQAYFSPNTSDPQTIEDIGGIIRQEGAFLGTDRGNTAGMIGRFANGRELILCESSAPSSNNNGLVTDRITRDNNGDDIGDIDSHKWWNPSGIMATRFRRNGYLMNPYNMVQSISFDGDQAYDEFEHNNQLPSNIWITGLYQNNYEDYLSNVYERTSRLSKFKVDLPPSVINQYALNDTVIVGTNKYNINKLKVNLLTGKGEVELINKLDIPVVEPITTLGQQVQQSITGINLLPASGDYLYDTTVVTKTFYEVDGTTVISTEDINRNGDAVKTDAELGLDRMQAEFPNLESISVIITWYGDAADDTMNIKPRLDIADGDPEFSRAWVVGSYDRTNTPTVTLDADGLANQGGTPGDTGLIEFVNECNSRGLKVMLYPFLQMDTPGKEWRGQITFNSETGLDAWFAQYSAFIRHYSQLFANNSISLDKFMIGTELVTLTRWNDNGRYAGVQHLVQLAEDVRNDFGSTNPVTISYGANWDEYHSHDGNYHMDELWTSQYIDAVGLDNYFPATDYQEPSTVTYDDIYAGYENGEGWDHYYSTYNDQSSKVDYSTPGGEFAWKNVMGWWDRNHTAHSYSTTAPPTYGTELLTSADFASIAWPWNYGSWSYIPSPTVSGGIATLPISGGDYPTVNPRIEQEVVTTSGTEYKVEVDVNNAGGIAIQALVVDPNNSFAYINGDTQTFATSGVITFNFIATSAASTLQILVQGVDGDSVELNSASIKEIVSGGTTTITNTAWTARMKPMFFAEYGFASVDGTTNQPNVFTPDLPRLSTGTTDFNIQRQGVLAFNNYWDDKTEGISGFAEDRYVWAYDLRPYPQFPNAGIWSDSDDWEKGHWLNGKLT